MPRLTFLMPISGTTHRAIPAKINASGLGMPECDTITVYHFLSLSRYRFLSQPKNILLLIQWDAWQGIKLELWLFLSTLQPLASACWYNTKTWMAWIQSKPRRWLMLTTQMQRIPLIWNPVLRLRSEWMMCNRNHKNSQGASWRRGLKDGPRLHVARNDQLLADLRLGLGLISPFRSKYLTMWDDSCT